MFGPDARAVQRVRLAGVRSSTTWVPREPVQDIGPAYILEFRDPDTIALELTARK